MNYHKCATYGCPNFADEFEYYCGFCKKQKMICFPHWLCRKELSHLNMH